jgi:hypothetical protein
MKNICFQMNRKAWLSLVMVLCLSFPALAQKITVSGTVTDPTGEPLIGASVLAQGTSAGVATDIDGNYHLDVDKYMALLPIIIDDSDSFDADSLDVIPGNESDSVTE